MQKQKSHKNILDNKIILFFIVVLAVIIPIVRLDKYMYILIQYDLSINETRLQYICMFGIIMTGIISLTINYNIFKVIYKLGNFEMNHNDLLILCSLSLLLLNTFNVIISLDYLSVKGVFIKNILLLLVYSSVFTCISFYRKKTYLKKGYFCTFIFCLISIIFDVLTNIGHLI